MRPEHGPSQKEPRRHRQPVRSIQTLKEDLSVRKWSAMTDLVRYDGTDTAAKEKGLVRSEGKDYVVQDGDVVLFRFNV